MNVWARLCFKPAVPRETLRIVQNLNSSFWTRGAMSDRPAMQICFDGHVTEISGRPTGVLRVEIMKPATACVIVTISDNHDARRPQVLEPHEMAEIRAIFFVQGVVAVDGKAWTATLVFIDQYGNRHKLKNCVFRGMPSPQGGGTQPK